MVHRRRDEFEDVRHPLANRLRIDPVLLVVLPSDACDCRLVSLIARCIESVTSSAYMTTEPSTLRAARPIVWMSDGLGSQESLLVRIENRHEGDLRQVQALSEQVDADEHVVLPQTEIPQYLDAFEGVDVRVEVPRARTTQFEEVVGEILGHLLGEGRHQHAVVLRLRRPAPPRRGRRSAPLWGERSPPGSTRPVGRMICSTTCVDSRNSHSPGRRRQQDRLIDAVVPLIEPEAGDCRVPMGDGSRAR